MLSTINYVLLPQLCLTLRRSLCQTNVVNFLTIYWLVIPYNVRIEEYSIELNIQHSKKVLKEVIIDLLNSKETSFDSLLKDLKLKST